MNYNDSIKKVLVVLIMIVALAAAVTVVMTFFMKKDKAENPRSEEVRQEITKTEVEANKDPEKFPTGIPIESGAKITQNYNATAADGRFQATKVFETNRTLAQNLTTYQEYMRSNGWEIQSTVDEENYKMVFGTKEGETLQVSIDNNLAQNIKSVNISYTEISQK